MAVRNIVLIGMPGTGKTTLGAPVAAAMGFKLVDTDDLLKNALGTELREFVREHGREAFTSAQTELITGISFDRAVISTGGGVVLSEETMAHLKKEALTIFINTPLEALEARFDTNRSLARTQGQSYADVYEERLPLYRRYCDIEVTVRDRGVDELADDLLHQIMRRLDTYTDKEILGGITIKPKEC